MALVPQAMTANRNRGGFMCDFGSSGLDGNGNLIRSRSAIVGRTRLLK